MNTKLLLPSLAILASSLFLAATGCSKSSGPDATPVTQAFANAETNLKADLEAAVTAAKAGDYPGAAAKLQSLAANARVTPEQKQAVQNYLAEVKTRLSDAAQQALEQASKAATDAAQSASNAASRLLQDTSKKVGDAANKALQDASKNLPPLPPAPGQ